MDDLGFLRNATKTLRFVHQRQHILRKESTLPKRHGHELHDSGCIFVAVSYSRILVREFLTVVK